VDLSGVIFVVLALAWAGFLIPRLLHHHDEVARTRAVDRFSSATRVLARREPVDGDKARLVITQRTTAPAESGPAGRSPAARPPAAVATAHRRAARAAARRRRRILGVLVVALLGVGVAARLAAVPEWAVAIPAGMTIFYVALCRVLARRERRSWQRLARTATSASAAGPTGEVAESVERDAVPEPEPVPAEEEARNAQGFAEVSAQEDTVTLRREDLQTASLWDPLPITLPTYVGKPKARRTVRTIDLSAHDVSSSGRDAADSQLVAQDDSSEDEAVEARRAVGS
jgi:hypothetical protein